MLKLNLARSKFKEHHKQSSPKIHWAFQPRLNFLLLLSVLPWDYTVHLVLSPQIRKSIVTYIGHHLLWKWYMEFLLNASHISSIERFPNAGKIKPRLVRDNV